VSVGSLSTCGIGPNDTPYCWEANGFGQLGIGRLTGNETPVAIASPEPYRSISVGSIQTCAISSDYRARCWGNNTFGQLGNHSVRAACQPSGLPCAPRPVGVRGTLRFMSLATGLGNHVCGVTTATNLYCWGLGNNGQLGDGDTRTVLRYEPTRVITPLQMRAQ
jgi:alpha-tubulin suppressor-like RCC1 family protein